MSGIGGFRGVSASQDARFVNKQKRMLKTKKFPKELDVAVEHARVNWAVIREWTAKRVTELLGVEDEVLIQFIHNRFEETDLNPKELYLELMPFLEKNTGLFMKELWVLLASATMNETGIPQQILDAKAEEVQQKINQQATIMDSIKEQRSRIEQEIESKAVNGNALVQESEKKEKGKRWAPPSFDLKTHESPRPREKGFSGGAVDLERSQRKKWSSRPHSPPRRRSERDRRSDRKRHGSRSPPRKRQSFRHRDKGRFFQHSAANNARSPGHERRRERHSVSPKAPRHHRERPQRHHDDHRHPLGHRSKEQKVPSPRHSLSRSPPESRHESPPPRAYNLGLARQKREHHDRKSRSVERQPLSRSPDARSPSPRSRNRMSSTPERREATPSPSTHISQQDARSTPSPIPKPPTPRTLTPPIRYAPEREPHARRKDTRREGRGTKPFGGMYGFRDDDESEMRAWDAKGGTVGSHSKRRSEGYQPRRDFDEVRRRDRSPHRRYLNHKSMETRPRNARQGYSYRSSFSPRDNKRDTNLSNTQKREKRRSGSESPMDRRHDLSDSGDIEKRKLRGDRGISRSRSPPLDYQRGKQRQSLDVQKRSPRDRSSSFGSKTVGSPSGAKASVDSGESSKAKEKLKRKLDEILEKKDSLCLD